MNALFPKLVRELIGKGRGPKKAWSDEDLERLCLLFVSQGGKMTAVADGDPAQVGLLDRLLRRYGDKAYGMTMNRKDAARSVVLEYMRKADPTKVRETVIRKGIEYCIQVQPTVGAGGRKKAKIIISLFGGRRPIADFDVDQLGGTRPIEFDPEFDPAKWAKHYISTGALDQTVNYVLRGYAASDRLPELPE